MAIRCGRRHVALFAALALGCESARRAGETAAFRLNPFGSTDVYVAAVEPRGSYLFAHVRGRQLDLRFAAPYTETCARVLGAETSVRYQKAGNFGRFLREDESCDAAGSLSLTAWRDRQPRRRSRSVVPRSTARYAVAYRDADYILLRGRFPLASRIGIPAGFDLVAVVPENEPCRAIAERREASLEFRQAGRDPFRLLTGDAPCVVEGFAMPVEGM
jgi:hypothetical protein